MQSWGQGKLEPSEDPQLVRVESCDHVVHFPHVLTLPFSEPPQSSMPTRTIVGVVLGAMVILGVMSGSVMMWMRKNNGMEESVAGCLMIVNQYTCTLCKRLPISGSVCRHSPYNKRQIHNGNGGSAQDSK